MLSSYEYLGSVLRLPTGTVFTVYYVIALLCLQPAPPHQSKHEIYQHNFDMVAVILM